MHEVDAGGTTVRLHDDGRLSVHGTDGTGNGPLLTGRPRLVVDGERASLGAPWTRRRAGGVVADYPAGDATLSLAVVPGRDEGTVLAYAWVEARRPVRVDAVVYLGAGATAFGPGARVYEHGHASWSPTGTLPVGERFPPEPSAGRAWTVDPAAPDAGTGAGARSSAGVTALRSGDEEPATLTLGFLDHRRFLPRIDVDDDAGGVAGLRAVCPLDGRRLDAGETLTCAALRLDAGRTVEDGLRRWAARVGTRMDARVPGRPPTGWCSWHRASDPVTEADVRAAVDALRDADLPLEVVLVDDGYSAGLGDPEALADGFEDLGALAATIREAGRVPGLRLAPFAAAASGPLATEHPEWLLRDAAGEPVDAGDHPVHGRLVALDTTRPGVESWLRRTTSSVVDDWGFGYLKLDRLAVGALPGERHADVPRAAAYRRGLRAIREAAGDAFLLGCAAPQAPSVGLVDAMRVGPDVAPEWDDADAGSAPAVSNAVRNALARGFLGGEWWVNDPDCLLLRDETSLTAAERGSFAALVALSGGSAFDSDRLAALTPGARDLLRRVLPPAPDGTVADLGARVPPRDLRCRTTGGDHRWGARARFNPEDEPATVVVDPNGGGGLAWDAWDRRLVEPPLERSVEPHGCALLHHARWRIGRGAERRPSTVGAADHLAAGVGLVETSWAEGDGAGGRLRLAGDPDRPVEAVVAVPDGWRVADPPADVRAADAGAVPYDAVVVPVGAPREVRFARS
jgi:alpha-galactosidase